MTRFLLAAMALATFAQVVNADDASTSSPPAAPLCGVKSLYTALKAEGVEVNYADLLQPQYVSSQAGSTFPELRKAAIDLHANAQLLDGLTAADLANLKCPAILHVKPEYDSPEYNHFILCVPTSNGRLALYDPPDPLVRTMGDELAAVWDGSALAISSRPIMLKRMWGHAAMRIALFSLVGLGILGSIRLVNERMTKSRWSRFSALTQVFLVLLSSIAIAIAFHLLSPQGFVAQRQAVAAIAAARFVEPPGKIELADARRLHGQGARFVDARNIWDFNHNHIDGAINLPPNASRLDRQRTMADCRKDQPLVVYCQGPSCPYAGLLAKRLAKDGFAKVHVFAGGFDQWSQAERAPASQRQHLVSRAGEGL